MTAVRAPAVAGLFYPDHPAALKSVVRELLRDAAARETPPVVPGRSGTPSSPVALIAPHAGYVYSGPIAASVYGLLQTGSANIDRVILFGPAHRVTLEGAALSPACAFRTPLGDIPVDEDAIKKILRLPEVSVNETAHAQEHSLEVHLPFLQEVLGEFRIVPLATGRIAPETICTILETLEPNERTLVVVSSDLSHYHDYETARAMDRAANQAILTLSGENLGRDHACGRHPVRGLLRYARTRGWSAHLADLRNSGDTAGDRDRVVGYGAYYFLKQSPAQAS